MTKVTSTEFQKNIGAYSDAALREPVYITKHNREKLVLLSVEDFERLKAFDTRQSLFANELSGEALKEMKAGYQGRKTPELDHLLK